MNTQDSTSAARSGAPGEASASEANPKQDSVPGAAGGGAPRKSFPQTDVSYTDGYGRNVDVTVWGWNGDEEKEKRESGSGSVGTVTIAVSGAGFCLHMRPTPAQARRIAAALIAAADSFEVPL